MKISFIICLLFPIISFAQVNIENLRFSKEGYFSTLSLGSQLKKGNNDVFDLKSSLRVDHNTRTNHFFILTEYEYGESNGEEYKDSKFLHLRNTYRFFEGEGIASRRDSYLSVEGFTQYQRNGFMDLELRQLLGLGLRYEEEDETKVKGHYKDVWAIGLGGMGEYESLISTDGDGLVFRLTSYLSIRNLINDWSYFVMSTYYQPKISNLSDFRLLSEFGYELEIKSFFSIRNSFIFNYDSKPPKGVENYDLGNVITLRVLW